MEKNLNEFTYQKLKKDIMTFVLVPGEAISAAKIAERYGGTMEVDCEDKIFRLSITLPIPAAL